MARDYSRVGTPSAAGGGAPTRSRTPWWIGGGALLVIVVLILVLAAACGGDDGGDSGKAEKNSTQGIGSAHGPQSITDGIPSGYTRDKVGVTTAGVNFVQAMTQANQGRISGEKLREQSVGTSATPALLEVMDQISGRGESENVYATIPVLTTVPEFSPDKAVVSVWQVDTGQSKVGDAGKVGVQTIWSTSTVTMSWSGSDWKAVDWKFAPGPNPADTTFPAADSPLAQKATNGYYSFYVD
ncbi:hypothetical protein [Williamsia sp. DF01-3]|uniref:hypothetical protein n=1 Tax=Williamsia sp. DF01-3 TaxID=2934157 RepID=UPI000DB8A7CC|nr:hypothetical protein [Williamsia sp. DF01-3]MCK0515763.1 hypothetical protein [Williamsia sp. DF01-3]PZU02011.1 MAG: hypothetical protein DI630_10045 [Gordonia sp. (in: high G+C Gram-positive bacteria)]